MNPALALWTALVVAVGLAQVGEFSFILGTLAKHYGLLSETGYNLLVASALVSIAVNPFLFRALDPFEAALQFRIMLLLLRPALVFQSGLKR